MKQGNLFRKLPNQMDQEQFLELTSSPAVRIERIVSRGQISPPGFWYDQATTEWVVVLKGAARLEFDGDTPPVEMKPGDYIEIPPQQRHRVEWTSPDEPTVWLAIHWPGEPR